MAVGASSDKKTSYWNYGVLTFISENKDVYGILPSGAKGYSSYFLAKAENKDSNPDYSEFYFNGKRVKFLPKITVPLCLEWKSHILKIQPILKRKKL